MFVWCIGGVAVAISCAFMYRFAALSDKIHLLHRRSSIAILVFAHITYAFPILSGILGLTTDSYENVMGDIQEVCLKYTDI